MTMHNQTNIFTPAAPSTSFRFTVLTCTLAILAACSGGGSSSDDPIVDGGGNGTLNVSLTDAPVDFAQSVVVEFSGAEIQNAAGEVVTFDFSSRCEDDPASCRIDLLALSGDESKILVDGETVQAGEYNSIRLMVNAEPNVRDSYIMIAGQEFELRIPSGAQSGLKINHTFTVPAGGTADFTIDFDLRKSVHQPVGQGNYMLRPTLRIVDNSEVGSLAGNIDANLFTEGCTGAVYLYEASVQTPDDEDGEQGGPDPIATVAVENDGVNRYEIGFITAGDYLAAFTCDAGDDNPETDEDSQTVSFTGAANVTIVANAQTTHDFNP